MARKGKRNARILLEEHRCEATVRVVARPEVGPRGLFTVEILDPLCPLAQIWPQLFLGEEVVGATGNAQDAYVRGIRISVDLRGELGPVRVHYATGQDIGAVSHHSQRPGDLPNVDELPAEVGVRGQVAVAGIEVPLRVQERDAHPAILNLSAQLCSPRADPLAGWRISLRGRSPREGGLSKSASAPRSRGRRAPSARPNYRLGWR